MAWLLVALVGVAGVCGAINTMYAAVAARIREVAALQAGPHEVQVGIVGIGPDRIRREAAKHARKGQGPGQPAGTAGHDRNALHFNMLHLFGTCS